MAPTASKKKRGKVAKSQLLWFVAIFIAYLAGMQTGLISSHSAQVADSPHSNAIVATARGGSDSSYKLAFEQSYGFFDDITDYNWKLMQERAKTRINHKFGSNLKFYEEPARWYMNNFEPDFTCAQERRVGGPGDGPKW
jgi:hypothetical protein